MPLTQIAKVGFRLGAGRDVARGPRLRRHRARRWVEGMQGATVTGRSLAAAAKRWEAKMPSGYRIDGRAVEEQQQGQGSIAVGVPIMLFIIFTLLMLQLHSFSRAMLVFLTGRWASPGGGALLLLNRPFGFVALLGVIALMGMIQRNSVILIDQIEQDRAVASRMGGHRRGGGAALPADRADGGGSGAGMIPRRAACSGARWPWPSWVA